MQSKFVNKIISAIIFVSLMFQLGMPVAYAGENNSEPPASAVAEVIKGGTATYTDTLQAAFDLIGSGETGTVKVLKDIDLGSTTNIRQTTGNVTLDLNGKTISAALTEGSKNEVFYIESNATLTITDSGENGEIRNVVSEGVISSIIRTRGTLLINDGKLYTEDLRSMMCGGTAVVVYDGTATITGSACLQGEQYAIQTVGGLVNVQGGNLISMDGIACNFDGSLNITGGLIQSTNQSIKCTGKNDITINGGTLIGMVFDKNDATATGNIVFNKGAIFGDTREGDNYYNPAAWTDMTSLTGWQVKERGTLPVDTEIPSGKTFTVSEDATLTIADTKVLTIAEGATLINNGTLLLKGMLNGTGTLAGSGDFKATVFTANDIQDITDQTYTGSAILPEVTFNPKIIMGKAFTIDTSSHTKSYEDNTNAGTAKVVFTYAEDGSLRIEKTFTIIAKSSSGGSSSRHHSGGSSSSTVKQTEPVKQEEKPAQTPAQKSLEEVKKDGAEKVKSLKDVKESSWYSEGIEYALGNGWFAGTTETTFRPSNPMTREMFRIVLGRMGADVNDLMDNNRLKEDITREQIVTLLYRMAQKKGLVKTDSHNNQNVAAFADGAQVSAWSKEAMAWANAQGIIKGDDQNMINPKEGTSRAEVAVMLMRFDTIVRNQ